jgi:UDP-N-acetylmuramyl pentapeptide phosphotransferase/UDP-N-acetylglucosamine-1-phosphate transferase
MSLSLPFSLSAIACAALIFITLRSPVARRIVDQPGRLNSMHTQPIPRIGGAVLMIIVFIAAWATGIVSFFWALLGATFFLSALSIIDDIIGLSAWLRLLAHLLAATFIALSFLTTSNDSQPFDQIGSTPTAAVVLIAIALIPLITWSTNLFNFMDGADGLAGGMALFGFGAYAIAASQFVPTSPEVASMATLCAITSGAALGFLFFNFSPAKVFMGDAGSISLGFLAAVLGIHGVSLGLWSWWFPLLVFSPFIVDATTTLIKRIARGEKIWIAHRQHYYHQLILSGWNHRRVALSYYGVMIACGGSALVARKAAFPAPLLAFWVVTYVMLIIFLEQHFKSKYKSKDSPQ